MGHATLEGATFEGAMYKDVLRLYNNEPLVVIVLTLRNHRKEGHRVRVRDMKLGYLGDFASVKPE